MATTDTKPGFRLPWSADRSASGDGSEGATETTPTDPSRVGAEATDAGPASAASQENETTAMIDAASATATPEAAVETPGASSTSSRATAPSAAASTPGGGRKPNKFMADLTKAMQAAAEAARTDTLERVAVDAKSVIEAIHAGSSTEATELRKRADDDVAAVREWSKQQIARIREETDERIAHRKARLEREIEEHAATIEARVERVQQRVSTFEAEMGRFFERLLAEDDPTRFASLAESLPEPPPLEAEAAWVDTDAVADDSAPASVPVPEAAVATATSDAPGALVAPEPAPAVTLDVPAPASAEAGAPDVDPRLAMLGLDQDFAAAEAEALAYTPDDEGGDDQVAELADDTIAARLAGIVNEAGPRQASGRTRVVVVGLVSVASIAGFKRHLSRVPGVDHVGVTSGPDGEFVFTVQHDAGVALRDVVATLPGFGARVTAETDGELTVSARDPETES